MAEYNILVQECKAELAILDRPMNLDPMADNSAQIRRWELATAFKPSELARLEMVLTAWAVWLEEVKGL